MPYATLVSTTFLHCNLESIEKEMVCIFFHTFLVQKGLFPRNHTKHFNGNLFWPLELVTIRTNTPKSDHSCCSSSCTEQQTFCRHPEILNSTEESGFLT